MDHACHQRCSTVQGVSQARIARSARGQDGAGGGGTAASAPPLSAAGPGLRCRVMLRRVFGEPGGPAEAERAGDQHLVAADRSIGADLEVGPAQLVLDLLITLLDPVPDLVDPHDLGQVRRRLIGKALLVSQPLSAHSCVCKLTNPRTWEVTR